MPGRRTRPTGSPHTAPALSDVELTVLEGRANGLTNLAISEHLHYTYRSTKDVAERVLRKLNARDMAHAVLIACRLGLLDGRPQRHGDHAGFAAHQRRGEDPWACEPCADAERAYRPALRAARKAAAANQTS
jgi:DNA-binding CsgD family transcriptional regulator